MCKLKLTYYPHHLLPLTALSIIRSYSSARVSALPKLADRFFISPFSIKMQDTPGQTVTDSEWMFGDKLAVSANLVYN